MKSLLMVFAFAAGTLLVVVGVQSNSFMDYTIGGLLLVFTIWEYFQRKP